MPPRDPDHATAGSARLSTWTRRARTLAVRPGLLLACLLATVPARGEGVALTFDDLPLNGTLAVGTTHTGLVRQVLAALDAEPAPASVGFVNAIRLEGNPDAARALEAWVAAGQRIGNHTYSHMRLDEVGSERFLEDVRRNEPTLELLSRQDWHWFRYPYLDPGGSAAVGDRVRQALVDRGYRIAEVTLDWEDWRWNEAYARCADRHDAAAIALLHGAYLDAATTALAASRAESRGLYGRDIDLVLLLHLGSYSPVILPDLLALLRAKGLVRRSLESVLADPAYAIEPRTGDRHGTLWDQWLRVSGRGSTPVPAAIRIAVDGACR